MSSVAPGTENAHENERTGSIRSYYSLPGYVDETTDTPPPTYAQCSIPPPHYDELYAPDRGTPKNRSVFPWRRKIPTHQKAIYICAIVISTTLLTVALVYWNDCPERPTLLIWMVVTACTIFVGIVLSFCDSLIQKLKKLSSSYRISRLIFFVIIIAWLVTGCTLSLGIVEKVESCAAPVIQTAYATCIIGIIISGCSCFCCFD